MATRDTITPFLGIAKPPAITDMLAELDRLRGEIEAGQVVALFLLPLFVSRGFGTRTAGSIGMLELIGMLEAAKADALDVLRAPH